MISGANSVHIELRNELENYIISQYFRKSPVLLEAIEGRLDEKGLLYQEPYIESSPAYKTLNNGISSANLPTWLRDFLISLADAGLGVYSSPFVHQVDALTNAFKGKDLFVSTGTGSGKTECFMWPLLSKIVTEAHENPQTWKKRGLRTIIMYPMNALVSDQIGRLRRLIGDPEDRFLEVFRKSCGYSSRRPQFGMYTGRTPYPGSLPSKKDDENLVKTLKNITALNNDENKEYYKRLIEAGKVPAKHDINSFLQKLNISEHVPDREDAELITRFEMQGCCPDILITNYSMLEYMLLRPREHNIWDSTKDWLDSDSHNKLLFVVDEAHMYRGSSGGEVALLIRRLMHKLGINRERIQFILTTASMPRESEEDRRAVTCFANALTANDSEGEFIYLVGERDPLPDTEIKDIQLKKFLEFEAGDFEGDGDNKLLNLLKFWSDVKGFDGRISNLEEICDWMFNNLICYRPFNELIKQCRGTAVSLGELARNVFPDRPEEDALSAVSVMLSIAPLAKSKNGAILFPARMHMLFRGINGVYACVNEECPCAHTDGHLSIGEVFLSDEKMTCPYCGSVVYELYQDRRCGTLFYKGYALEKDVKNVGVTYLWHYHGQLMDKSLKEYHLYIPEEGVIVDVKAKPCYLDIKTGFIYTRDDAKEGIPGFRKLYFGDYTSKGHPDVNTFSKCPHCKHSLSSMSLTSFSTKGNQSFFNLIQTQFLLQPSVDNKGNEPDRFPNGGRKVLLFSDSRQRAAKLARDMTDMSETMVARQLFSVAISLYERSNVKQSMNDLYDYICIAAGMKHLQMFYDNDRDTFLEHSRQALRNYKKSQKRREDFEPEKNMTNAPRPIHKLLLKMFCGAYNTLPESAYCWIEPTKNALYKAVDELGENGLSVSELEFLELFNAWMLYVCDEYVALGHIISDDIREEVRNVHHSYGIPKDWKFREFIYRRMGWKTDDNIVLIWKRVLKECFLSAKQPDNGNLYVDLSKIKPCYNPEHTWYKCEVCSELTPYMLKCGCPNCGADKIHEMTDQEYSALRFWRGPIESAINGGSIQIIDTEEHTAQLSYKDQRDELWSKTEQYELRFQDLVQKGETPVDILSSTTTMEVGIDIGSLVAVGLRNIPPMRENYQQRAGRAGRRGSSLSTIVTFCEDGPHDTLYFKNPVPMFRGDPRKPWIDIKSPKLIERHISIVVFREFFDTIGDSVDSISVPNFFDKIYDDFLMFLNRYQVNDSNLIPKDVLPLMDIEEFKKLLKGYLSKLNDKYQSHPELYGKIDGVVIDNYKTLLDALYEEGIIPTYSFPKNVVSTYICDNEGKIKYQVERGLDIAIGEYAPGRAIVVDKKIYQIGGFYVPNSDRKKGMASTPALAFTNDPNYVKSIVRCPECEWFGLKEDNIDKCPFCSNPDLIDDIPMLKPWGFAPKNAEPMYEPQVTETYSHVQLPLYSTLPGAEEMHSLKNCVNMRIASRSNQRIIMVNRGKDNNGFAVCRECGAVLPRNDSKTIELKNINRPYKNRYARSRCQHSVFNANIGYDFITDMLVLEIRIDNGIIDMDNRNNPWVNRATCSLSEALRLAASYELDIEFGELVSGYRIRRNGTESFIDIYMYDNLSSGAGYSVSVANEIDSLLVKVRDILSTCKCESACHNCLKHYRNQFVHGNLDRFAALDLLDWAISAKLPDSIDLEKQKKYIEPLRDILFNSSYQLQFNNDSIKLSNKTCQKSLIVYPAMWNVEADDKTVFVSDGIIKYAKPYAVKNIIDQMNTF